MLHVGRETCNFLILAGSTDVSERISIRSFVREARQSMDANCWLPDKSKTFSCFKLLIGRRSVQLLSDIIKVSRVVRFSNGSKDEIFIN